MSGFTREQYGELFKKLIEGYVASEDVRWHESLDSLAEPDTLLTEDQPRTLYLTAARCEQETPSIVYMIGLHKN